MKKRITLLTLFLLAVMTMSAIPARPNLWRMITLADGSQVKARLVGDEHGHWYRGIDGNTYVSDGNGIYKNGDAKVVAAHAAKRRAQANAHFTKRRKADISGNRGNFQGTKKGIIILANFKDKKFSAGHNLELYKQIANGKNYKENGFYGSIKDYFSAQSDGKFTIDFDVVGPVTLSQNMAYYGGNDSEGNDKHPEQMIKEACELADSYVNFADYDWSGNGEVDQVYVIYAGQGEANGGSEDTVWPHAYELAGANITLSLDGVKINSYACSAELGYSGIDGIGTICHEFSHCLGYPDLYDIFYEGHFGMSSFDLMDSAGYNDDGFCPAGYTAYEKWIAGWIDYEVLEDENVTVTDLKPTCEGGKAYVIYNKGNRNEYFILENRQQTKWDTYIEATGLQVIHVDYDPTCWINNVVNSMGEFRQKDGWTADFKNDHQRLTLVHADNIDDSKYWNKSEQYYTKTTLDGDLYPYKSNNELSDTSTPSFGLYNDNEDGTRNMGRQVKDITENDNGTVNFQYNAAIVVEPTPEGQVFYESFDKCAGTGGNDGTWSSGSNALVTDNAGWESVSRAGGFKCGKFGSSKKSGYATTPSFALNGKAKLTFKAAPYGSDATSLKVTYNGAVVATLTMKNEEWTEYSIDITGTGTGKITFTPAKRMFLDEVRIVADGVGTGIDTVETTGKPVDNRVYNIQGQYLGTSLDNLPAGIYIVGGKKVVK